MTYEFFDQKSQKSPLKPELDRKSWKAHWNYSSIGEVHTHVWHWLINLICVESWTLVLSWTEINLHVPPPFSSTSIVTAYCWMSIAFLLFFINNDTNENSASFVLLSDNLDWTLIRDGRPFAQASIRLWLCYSPASAMLRHWLYARNFQQWPNSREAPFSISQILHVGAT